MTNNCEFHVLLLIFWNMKFVCPYPHFLYIEGRDDQIATSTRLLSIKYEFYGFSGDLIETII